MRGFMHRLLAVFLLILPAGMARSDEASLRAAIEKYVEAFNAKDLTRVTAMWTENARHIDRATGEKTEGREAIKKDIQAVFSDHPTTRLSGHVDVVRMITPEVAKVDGQTYVTVAEEPPIHATFSAIVVLRDGIWLIDSLDEMPLPQPPTSYDALQRLAWLEGKWVDSAGQSRIETSVSWSPNRAFLIRSFTSHDDQGVSHQGTQVIGWDPRSQEIRSWIFNSDGSFGDGVWEEVGREWLIRSRQTTATGLASSGTYVLTRVDEDTLEIQLIGHDIEGEPQPSTEVIQVKRAPAAASAPIDSTSAIRSNRSGLSGMVGGVSR